MSASAGSGRRYKPLELACSSVVFHTGMLKAEQPNIIDVQQPCLYLGLGVVYGLLPAPIFI